MTGRQKFSELWRRCRRSGVRTWTAWPTSCARKWTSPRTARQLSHAALGEILHVEQPAVAKIEKRTDMYVSTLRRFIEAMGGELEITARFPDHNVRIKNFSDLGGA